MPLHGQQRLVDSVSPHTAENRVVRLCVSCRWSTMECPYAKTMTRSLQTASALPTSSKGQSWVTPALTSSYSQSTAHRFEPHPGHRCSDSRQAPSTDMPEPCACGMHYCRGSTLPNGMTSRSKHPSASRQRCRSSSRPASTTRWVSSPAVQCCVQGLRPDMVLMKCDPGPCCYRCMASSR